MSEARTERATPRKRQKASEKGDRIRSRELVAATGMVAGVLALGQILKSWASEWSCAYQTFLGLGAATAWQDDRMASTVLGIRHAMVVMLSPLMLLFASVAGTALLVSIAQGGGLRFNVEALQPKWERINPGSNLKNLFSLRGVTRLVKSLLPAAVLLVFAIRRIEEQAVIPPLSVERLPLLFGAVYSILLDTAWILFAWSAVDYLVEWRSWENRQKMSRQEMRDEYRQTEGNPQVRGRIRSLRRQMRRRQLKADVSRASVVITNPTHYAVALSFDFETMEPPRVLAKGRGLLAEQIKSEARWAGVPVIENPPLARSLYRHVEPGQAIPFDLYAVVAAILAYLYRQQVEDRVRRERAAQQAYAKRTGAVASPHPKAGTVAILDSIAPHKEKP
ncbi:MAG TPA: EscU/YscU/HrcU family type III secretion system export apparatus switch protein [Silvibacterium sp.]|jgi:flagellar biosynthetic protein FlhB|nr:EscU/YscU/HrcU family type III secretion system export apparatus switch protein [Silvibacterium sp.]